MEKTFNYNISDLKSLLNLIKIYEHTSEDIDKDIEGLQSLINFLSKKSPSSTKKYSLKTLFKEDIITYQFFKPFYPYIKDFTQIGHNLEEIYSTPKYKKRTLNDFEAVHLAQNFLKSQGPFFKNPLEEFEEEINTHLKFISNTLDTSGGVLYLHSTGEAFVFSPNITNITKASILTHELEHVIDSYNNPSTFNTLITREILPVFMENISLPTLEKQLNLKKDGYKRMLHLYSLIKESAFMLSDKMDMLDLVANNLNLKEEDLITLLDDNGYDQELIGILMDRNITSDFFYQIPELIAIELYFIYQNDKQKALAILENISLHGTDSNLLEQLKKHNITLNSNVSNYEKHILSKTKR